MTHGAKRPATSTEGVPAPKLHHSPVLGFLGDASTEAWGFLADRPLLFSALAVILIVGIVSLWQWKGREAGHAIAARGPAEGGIEAAEQKSDVSGQGLPGPGSDFLLPPSTIQSGCLLALARGVRWAGPGPFPAEMDRLAAGKEINMLEGRVELAFDRGARMVLEGRTHIRILGPLSIQAYSGNLMAHVGEQAHGFTVITSRGNVVDLGTEFGLHLDACGAVQVAVFKGRVDVESAPATRLPKVARATAFASAGNSPAGCRRGALHGCGGRIEPAGCDQQPDLSVSGYATPAAARPNPPAGNRLGVGQHSPAGKRPLLRNRARRPARGRAGLRGPVLPVDGRDERRHSGCTPRRRLRKDVQRRQAPWRLPDHAAVGLCGRRLRFHRRPPQRAGVDPGPIPTDRLESENGRTRRRGEAARRRSPLFDGGFVSHQRRSLIYSLAIVGRPRPGSDARFRGERGLPP